MNSKATPRSKAALVDLADLSSIQQEQKEQRSSLGTAPGQAMQNTVLRKELEQWRGASPVRQLDPKTVIHSKWANRHEESFKDEEFELLKADIFSSGGNVQPIKVRPAAERPGVYEVIFGHRRHQACQELGLPVLSMIADMTDQQMFVEMDRENRQRKDLRPYEQGKMYEHALSEKLFPSATKMAEATGIHLGSMGKALLLARLPSFVIGAFHSPLDLQYRWADALHKAAQDRADEVKDIVRSLRAEKEELSAKEIFERVTGEDLVGVEKGTPHKVSLDGSSGQRGMIRVNPLNKSITVSLKNIDTARSQQLEELIKKFIA